MYFGITPLSEHSENDIETTPPKTAIAETQHIDSKYMPNAADTCYILGKTLTKRRRRISQER